MLQHGGLPTEAKVGEVLNLVRRSFPQSWPLDDLVATAGIDGLLGRDVEALSGGQRQRVLLALALAGAPPLLLLDEPTSAMDIEGRRGFWTTMRGLAGRGHTVVFATHHLDEADAVADRVVVIAGGRIVADGSTAEVKAGVSGRTISFTAHRRPRAGRPARGHRRRAAERHGHAHHRRSRGDPAGPARRRRPAARPRGPRREPRAGRARTDRRPPPTRRSERPDDPAARLPAAPGRAQPAVPDLHRAAARALHRSSSRRSSVGRRPTPRSTRTSPPATWSR